MKKRLSRIENRKVNQISVFLLFLLIFHETEKKESKKKVFIRNKTRGFIKRRKCRGEDTYY